MNTLEIQNLSKLYPNGVTALDNVSLNIGTGMYGLLGANGAGKSTLMRTIATLQEPSEGTITFNGSDIISYPNQIRDRLGYLPQEFGVYPRISAEKLLNHLAILKGIVNKRDRKGQVEALLQQTNLYQHRKQSVHTFSGGMRQRFGIAQALLGDPQVIIVDEPTAGLDPEERNRFLNLLSELGENIIVILSTHLVDDVYHLCSKMAILANGKIVEEGSPQELAAKLTGKIWLRTIEKGELENYKKAHKVISTKLVTGHTQVKVFAEELPEPGFTSVSPELEDVYFISSTRSTNTQAQ